MKKDLEVLSSFYIPRLATHGASASAAVGFDDEERRALRWKVLTECSDMSTVESVLDIGCGLGHMSEYLEKSGFKGHYCGLEALKEFVIEAKKLYPNKDISQHNFLQSPIEGSFDCIMSNGLFTLASSTQWENLQMYLERCFEGLREGGVLAFNLFPGDVNFHDPQFAYFDINRVIEMVSLHTRTYILRRDYLPFDITLYCYKKNFL